jgi:hypothetical protein
VTLGLAVTTTMSASTNLLLTLLLAKVKAANLLLTLAKLLGLLLHLGQSLLKALCLSLSPLRCLSNGSRPTSSKFESLSNSSANAFR